MQWQDGSVSNLQIGSIWGFKLPIKLTMSCHPKVPSHAQKLWQYLHQTPKLPQGNLYENVYWKGQNSIWSIHVWESSAHHIHKINMWEWDVWPSKQLHLYMPGPLPSAQKLHSLLVFSIRIIHCMHFKYFTDLNFFYLAYTDVAVLTAKHLILTY